MKQSLTILLFACAGSGVGFSQSIGGLAFETVFDFVDDGMPAAFEVGQSVFFEFDLDTGVEASTVGSFTSYQEAVTGFSMQVPEASFEAALDFGTLSLPVGSSEVWISAAGNGQTFQGQELISVDLVLDRSDGGSRFEALSRSEDYFSEAFLDSWSVSFLDANTNNSSTGSIFTGSTLTAIPEPTTHALVSGIVVFVLIAGSRMRSC